MLLSPRCRKDLFIFYPSLMPCLLAFHCEVTPWAMNGAGRGSGRSCRPVASWARDEDPDHLPGICTPSGCPVTDEKWTKPTAQTTGFRRDQEQGTLPTVPRFLECCCVLGKLFPRPAHLGDIPESPGRPDHCLPQTLAAGAGQERVPSLLEARDLSAAQHVLFSPKKWGGEGRTWEQSPTRTLGCFSHLSRQYNNERELGSFRRGN